MRKAKGRALQAEGTARAKALRWDRACFVWLWAEGQGGRHLGEAGDTGPDDATSGVKFRFYSKNNKML